MLVGYNTNVPYKGSLYHIQTEDGGLKNPSIVTLLYIKGTILSSKKTSYADIVSAPDCKERVRELMKEQHKNMMKELIRGKYTVDEPQRQTEARPPELTAGPRPEPKPEAVPEGPGTEQHEKPAISRSLDDILLDFIISRGK